MKRFLSLTILTLVLSLCIPTALSAAGPSKAQKRVAYTLKNLGVDQAKQKQMQPMLLSYLADLKAAKKKHDDLKKKYEIDLKKGTVTDNAATVILKAKFECDAAELQVKKSYLSKFSTILPPKKVLRCFQLLNDKMSKVEQNLTGKAGSKASNDDDDDED